MDAYGNFLGIPWRTEILTEPTRTAITFVTRLNWRCGSRGYWDLFPKVRKPRSENPELIAVQLYVHIPTHIYIRIWLIFSWLTVLEAQGLLTVEVPRSNSDTSHTVRLLWASDRLVAETSTWRYTTLTPSPLPGRDSSPQSQQANGCRHMPPGSAHDYLQR